MLVGVLVDLLCLTSLRIGSSVFLALSLAQLLELLASVNDLSIGARTHAIAVRMASYKYHLVLARWYHYVVSRSLLWLHHRQSLKVVILDLLLEGCVLLFIIKVNKTIALVLEALVLFDICSAFVAKILDGYTLEFLHSFALIGFGEDLLLREE